MRSLLSQKVLKIVVLIAQLVSLAAAFAPQEQCAGAESEAACCVDTHSSTVQAAAQSCCEGCESCGSTDQLPQPPEHSLLADSASAQSLLRSCLLAAPLEYIQICPVALQLHCYAPQALGHCAPHIRSVVLRS
jgi:hypothetical protein